MMQTSPAAASPSSRTTQEPELRAQGSEQARTQERTQAQTEGSPAPLIQVTDLQKSYKTARGALNLFHGLSLTVNPGEMVAIVGQSGAGKSTLLHILGALDAPSAGTVYCASTNVAQLSPREAAAFRNREIGYVWQFHYLLPEFTALENVAMPLLARGTQKAGAPGDAPTLEGTAAPTPSLGWKTGAPGDAPTLEGTPAPTSSLGWKTGAPGDAPTLEGTPAPTSSLGWKREALRVAANWLREVGLEDRGDHRPGELSGGEQQRVALARALVNNPRLLLADEPTGDLDEITAGRVFDLIERLHASHGLTSILVTHNLDLAARCTRALRLEGGRLAPLPASPQTGSQAGII